MKLHFKETGSGRALIILHGLFGSGDNWATLAGSFATSGYRPILVDQRNHGRSPHDPTFSYPVMADDLQELITVQKWDRPVLLGHSMGGKTAMFYARRFPESLSGLVVADMAPRAYAPRQQEVFRALNAVDLSVVGTRKQAEELLRSQLNDTAVVQFLLKNLYWDDHKRLSWRFDLQSLERAADEIGKAVPDGPAITVPTLFLKGGASDYILESDDADIRKRFGDVRIRSIAGAGHWLHADAPEEFFREVIRFLEEL